MIAVFKIQYFYFNLTLIHFNNLKEFKSSIQEKYKEIYWKMTLKVLIG